MSASIPSSVITGNAAEIRLRQLDLEVDDLHETIHVGYTHAAGCTDHDPRSLPGTLAWGKGIGHLRDITKPRGWNADRASNFETVVHPSNSHAVALAAGTSQTGHEDGLAPRMRTPKGPATTRAVKNNAQLRLGHGTEVFGGMVEDDDRETWFLLHYFDAEAEEIRIELSSPLAMEGTQITAWRERIVLPPVPFSTDVDFAADDAEEIEIEIDVPRRSD